MQSHVGARSAVLILAVSAGLWGADETRWGPVQRGLQLGIEVVSTPEPAVIVSLKNAGPEPRELVIGSEWSENVYSVELTAAIPGHEPLYVFDLRLLKAHPLSLLLPIRTHLDVGQVREFLYPLSQLMCVVNRRDVPLRALVEQGYRIQASFDFSWMRLTTPDVSLRQ
jgi:hypothetical protein